MARKRPPVTLHYKGPLATPIVITTEPTPRTLSMAAVLGSELAERAIQIHRSENITKSDEALDRAREILLQRLQLLAKHYGLNWPQDASQLVVKMALAHVPGFRIELCEKRPTAGRPVSWPFARLMALEHTVSKIKDSALPTKLSDLAACRILASKSPWNKTWKPPASHRGTLSQWVTTLRSRLVDARKVQRDLEAFYTQRSSKAADARR